MLGMPIIEAILWMILAFLFIRIAARSLGLDETEKNAILFVVILIILFWLF